MRNLVLIAAAALTLGAYLLLLPFTAVWFIFWVLVGRVLQSPDRLANRYYRLAVWPLLLPVCLLPDDLPKEAVNRAARFGGKLQEGKIAAAHW